MQKVYVALLKVIGDRHLKPAFTSAVAILCKSTPLEFVEGQKMVNYDSLQFFELIHIADLLQQMLDVYYTEDIVRFPNPASMDRRE